jgi:transcription-repair coupling factor (superfamily II helicase)
MSVIETPPKDRLAIQTQVVKFSTDVIATAIRQELLREGQVYFVHNRVESIYSLASLVTKLVPEARVAVAHGQMREGELEKSMLAFVRDAPMCWWPPPSSRTASTSHAPTPCW